ncbi:unnamed protein product [Closterium sp. NIES-54]
MEQQRPTLRTETLCWILEEAHGTNFDEENRPRPYTRDVYRNLIDKAWKDPDAKEELSVKEEEDKARAEKKAKLYEERVTAGWDEESARRGAWGDDDGTGATWGSAIGASGTVQGWGTGRWGDAERRDLAEGELTQEEIEESEIEEGNVPTTPPRDSLGPISRPDPFARFIEGTQTPLNIIPYRNFLALYLMTAPAEGETEAEAEAEEPDNEEEPGEEEGKVLQIPHETEEKAAEHHARYLCTSGIRADEDLWHQ